MDKVILKGMAFSGCHGVLAEEKKIPQKFLVDIVLYLDLKKAAREDKLALTVDYAEVFKVVRQLVENTSFNLIETLAYNICEKVLSEFPAHSVETTVYKPEAPVEGDFEYFAAAVTREK